MVVDDHQRGQHQRFYASPAFTGWRDETKKAQPAKAAPLKGQAVVEHYGHLKVPSKERYNITKHPCRANSGEYASGISNSADKVTCVLRVRPRARLTHSEH